MVSERVPSTERVFDGIIFALHYERFTTKAEAEKAAGKIRDLAPGTRARVWKQGRWYYVYRTKKGGAGF